MKEYMKPINEMVAALPPEHQAEVRDFIEHELPQPLRHIEPEEEAAGWTLVAVAVADDLIGEIEFGAVERAVFLHVRLVVIGRNRHFLRRHRSELAGLPVALFAMGPRTLADEEMASSRAQLDAALAKEPALEPLATVVFGGSTGFTGSVTTRCPGRNPVTWTMYMSVSKNSCFPSDAPR